MSKDGTWGDHIVLVALAHALGRTIRVVTSLDTDCHQVIVEADNQEGEPLLLGHLSENHYVSLEPMRSVAPNFQGMPTENNKNNYNKNKKKKKKKKNAIDMILILILGYENIKVGGRSCAYHKRKS